jgi:putative endonuclease
MHHFVYILKSIIHNKIYIGYTTNLKERIRQHNAGESNFTSKYRPWRIVYFEYYSSKKDALNREKQLKRFAKAYGQLKRRIKNSLEGN